MKVWFNGKIRNIEDDSKEGIGFLTHAFNYGTGAFEGIRSYELVNGKVGIFRLKDHIDRLFYSSEYLNITLKYSKKEIIDACKEVVKENNLKNAYIRPIVYYSSQKIGLGNNDEVNIVVFAIPFDKYINKKHAKVMLSSYKRISPLISNPKAKITGHYIISSLATQQAKKHGYDEALMLDLEGRIAEGAGENIAFIKDNEIIFAKSDSILEGITRKTIMEIAEDMGFKVKEENIYPHQLDLFDEAFFMGTAVEIIPISQINNIEYKTKKSETIKRHYLDIVKGKVTRYRKWIEIIN